MAAPVNTITLDMRATFGPGAPFFGPDQPTPPGKLEYLAALEVLIRGAASTPYAVTGLTFNYNDTASADGLWRWAERYGPGVLALRSAVTRSYTLNTSGTVPDAQVTATISSPASNDRVDIPPSLANGAETYPLTANTVIDRCSETFDATPAAAGQNRLSELTPSLSPSIEEYTGKFLFGFGGTVRSILDLGALVPSGTPFTMDTTASTYDTTIQTWDQTVL